MKPKITRLSQSPRPLTSMDSLEDLLSKHENFDVCLDFEQVPHRSSLPDN